MLDEILQQTAERYHLQVAPGRKLFEAYLKRQVRVHPEYNIERVPSRRSNSVELLADKLYAFAILARRHPVISLPHHPQGTLIDNDEKLPLLKQRSNSQECWDDPGLFWLFNRRNRLKKELYYRDLFSAVGSDVEIRTIWGRAIHYDKDILHRDSVGPCWSKYGYS